MSLQDALVRLVDSSPTFEVVGNALTLTGDGVDARLRQKP
jgi:hypothetical protein